MCIFFEEAIVFTFQFLNDKISNYVELVLYNYVKKDLTVNFIILKLSC